MKFFAVITATVQYEADSLVEAVDICYKSIKIIRPNMYPKIFPFVWQFLDYHVFQMNESSSKAVTNLCRNLKLVTEVHREHNKCNLEELGNIGD